MRPAAFVAGAASITFGCFVFACSLGLDESLIDKKDGGPVELVDATSQDGTTVSESGVPVTPGGQACKTDADCVASNACLTGRCDQSRATCTFDVCRPAACSVGACNQTAKTCGTATTYKEEAAQFTLPAPISCGNCIAAAYPYLFVGTTLGLLAYNVGNVALANPATIPVTNLGFIPISMTRSGDRLWLAGSPSGSGSASTMPVAYIDIPADPFATSITASNHLIAYNRPPEGFGLLARDSETALIFSGAATNPSSVLTAPLTDPVTQVATALVSPATTYSPVVMSGTRLVLSDVTGNVAAFALVSGAGSATPSTGAPVTIADAGTVSSSRAFAQATDGTVFWQTGVNSPPVETDPPNPPVSVTTAKVRGYFLIADSSSQIAASITGVDIETYTNLDATTTLGADGAAAGPIAMLDNADVMVTTAAKESPGTLTAVQFLKRDPLSVVAGKRVTISAPLDTIAGASGSNGIGYVVANDPGALPTDPSTGHVYVFDSACSP